jgi:hypothetical protein
MPQDLTSHFDDGIRGRNLFRTDLHTIKNGLAAPHPLLVVHRPQDFLIPSIPGIDKKTISLGQHGGPQEFGILFKCRASSETDAAEDAIDIGINLLTLLFVHQIFHF